MKTVISLQKILQTGVSQLVLFNFLVKESA
jgi:hypothetical protein